jgi:hypothetical protein
MGYFFTQKNEKLYVDCATRLPFYVILMSQSIDLDDFLSVCPCGASGDSW